MIPVVLALGPIAFALSVWLASKGVWGALALPAAFVLAGLLLNASSVPRDDGGGDGDPQRIVGSYTLLIGALWTCLTAVMVAVMRREQRHAERS